MDIFCIKESIIRELYQRNTEELNRMYRIAYITVKSTPYKKGFERTRLKMSK